MNCFAQRRRSLLRVVLCVMLATACRESTAVPTSPAPTPAWTQHRVSGIVTDAAGAAPIANATLVLRHTQGQLTTRTDAAGAYAFSFDASGPYRSGYVIAPGDFLGLVVARDGAHFGAVEAEHWTTVQLLPWGTRDVVANVRLRPVRKLAPGESMRLSVEPDSSLVWDKEWDPWDFPSFDTLEEQFLISVQTDGVLTIDVRPEAGGNVATLTCQYVGCPSFRVQAGTVSIPVKAGWSPFYFTVEIPRASAPQRYEIRTSLR